MLKSFTSLQSLDLKSRSLDPFENLRDELEERARPHHQSSMPDLTDACVLLNI